MRKIHVWRQLDNSTRQGHETSDPEHLGSCSREILLGQKDGFMEEGLRLDGLFIQNEGHITEEKDILF